MQEMVTNAVKWTKGAILEPQKTWAEYKLTLPEWKMSFLNVALPVIVITSIVAFILHLIFTGAAVPVASVMMLVIKVVATGGGLFLSSAIIDALAPHFGGKKNFNQAFAAMMLISLPLYVVNSVSVIPVIGGLVALAGLVYALYLLYQIIPTYFEVTAEKQNIFFGVSVVSFVVANMIIGMLLAALLV